MYKRAVYRKIDGLFVGYDYKGWNGQNYVFLALNEYFYSKEVK